MAFATIPPASILEKLRAYDPDAPKAVFELFERQSDETRAEQTALLEQKLSAHFAASRKGANRRAFLDGFLSVGDGMAAVAEGMALPFIALGRLFNHLVRGEKFEMPVPAMPRYRETSLFAAGDADSMLPAELRDPNHDATGDALRRAIRTYMADHAVTAADIGLTETERADLEPRSAWYRTRMPDLS